MDDKREMEKKTVDIEVQRKPVKFSGLSLLALSFQTLGIIYSDIGTSPLYVLNGIWPSDGPAPSQEDVIGGISCIIWALTIIPLIKYVFIALRFGTAEGEGGCFALYHGLIPPPSATAEEDRTLTGDSFRNASSENDKRWLYKLKWFILPWTLFGTSLTMADGVFTPAVSVTSAVGGIAVAVPSVSNHIIPISIGFLLVLFIVQRFGTAKLAFAFSPITFTWLALLAITGIFNIAKFPGIFRAFDPSRAVLLFVRTKNFELLAGVLLAITGCEALFANLGQFNMLSIQISFSCITYPALLLAYLGQGARLIVDGKDVLQNVFYQTIPGPVNGPLFWIMYVLAILATLVASQALITATFSLMQQLMNMKSFLPLRMVYTSETVQGQIYIPAANWTLAILTVVVVAVFKNLTSLTNAYGFAVSTVLFVTTTMITVQCRYVKRLPWFITLGFFVCFGFFDGIFWIAALKKVPQGAWVPLTIGSVLLITMVFWSWARGLEDEFDGRNRMNLRHFIVSGDNEKFGTPDETGQEFEFGIDQIEKAAATSVSLPISSASKGVKMVDENGKTSRELAVLPITAIFHKFAGGKGTPHSFVGFLRQYPALPRVVIFLSVRVIPVARVPPEDRYVVNKVRSLDGFYGVTYQLGFRDDFDVRTEIVIEEICRLEMHIRNNNVAQYGEIIREIRDAAQKTTHIIPHYHVLSKHVGVEKPAFAWLNYPLNWMRQVLIEVIYRRLITMFPETANWLTAADEIIRVGVTARI